MWSVYIFTYGIPALGMILGIYWILQVIANAGGGRWVQACVFIALVTLFLTPAIAGSHAGSFWIPSGIYVLFTDLPPLDQPRFVDFAIYSSLTTFAISCALAYLLFFKSSIIKPATKSNWVRTTLVPGLICLVLLVALYAQIPSRDIGHFSWAVIEAEFGHEFDLIESSLEPSSEDEQWQSILARIESDPVFWSVEVSGMDIEEKSYRRDISKRGSCIGADTSGVMRCSRNIEGEFFDKTTLYFRRITRTEKGNFYKLEVELDYDELLLRYPERIKFTLSKALLEQQDKFFLGDWVLRRVSTIGDRGPRTEQINLTVASRISDGVYEIAMDPHIQNEDGSAALCEVPQDRCHWPTEPTRGKFYVRGSRALLTFNNRTTHHDYLHIRQNQMVGRDPWGNIVEFKRTAVKTKTVSR